jgi:DNA-binding response OmpR family regulator
MQNKDCLLLVGDKKFAQNNNRKILLRRGYVLHQVETLSEARSFLAKERASVIILDTTLPDGSGLDFLKELRGRGENVPMLMLATLSRPEEQVAALVAGSDDYMARPYNFEIFLAKIEALLRRSAIIPETMSIGRVRLNIVSQSASIGEKDLNLTTKEFALLLFFVQNKDMLMSASNIYEKVWGQSINGNNQALKTAVSRLRNKLGKSDYTIYYQRGDKEGYIFEKK